MPTLSPESVEIAARHQVFLERLKTHEANKFNEVLRQIDRTIREKLSAVDFQSLTEKQLERLIQRVNDSVATLLDGYIAENAKALRETARYEAGFEARAIQQVARRAGFAAVVPAAAEVYAVLDTRPMSVRDSRAGMTVPQVAKAFKSGQLERLQNRIRLGYFEGLSTQQMLTSIRGLARLNYQDGELAQVARAASVFARDSFQMASSSGKFAAMSVSNIREYEWVSKLDSRTSSKCRSLDGMRFELGKGPLPPIHPNCRSTVTPVLPDSLKPLTDAATRNAEGGAVDSDATYYSWLKTQPTKFVEEVLGKSRAKLFLNGEISAERFAKLSLDRNFQPLTLEEMRKLEPLAFERAGL